jgi:hypothetical protein
MLSGFTSLKKVAQKTFNLKCKNVLLCETCPPYLLKRSVPDPDPDPTDPRVFWPSESGSTSQRYGSGSGSFYHHAKIIRKTLNSTIL